MSLSNRAMIIEIGTTFIRGGVSGMYCPRFIIDTDGILDITDEALLANKFVDLFQYIFTEKLCIKAKEYSVLIIEKVTSPQAVADVLLTILLRVFQVISVSIQPDLFVAALSSGISTGVIVSIGEKETQAICIAQGRPLLQTFRSGAVGVTNAIMEFNYLLKDELEGLEILMKQIDKDGDGDLSPEELMQSVEATRSVFEQVACCNLKDKRCADIVINPSENVANDPFTIESKFRHQPLEAIIRGESGAEGCLDEKGGAAGLVLDCLKACNMDVRSIACKHIVFIGGGAMLPGLCKGICECATAWALSGDKDWSRDLGQVIGGLKGGSLSPLPSPFIRSSLAWIGGSVFASLNSNYKKFLKLQDLDRVRDGGTSANGGSFFVSPDWRSLDYHHWQFWGPAAVRAEDPMWSTGGDDDSLNQSYTHSTQTSRRDLRNTSLNSSGLGEEDVLRNIRGQYAMIRTGSQLYRETKRKNIGNLYDPPLTP